MPELYLWLGYMKKEAYFSSGKLVVHDVKVLISQQCCETVIYLQHVKRFILLTQLVGGTQMKSDKIRVFLERIL